MTLEGKVAIVTGSSRGIGKAIAKAFAVEGAKVLINYASNDEAAKKIKEELVSMGCTVEIFKASVEKESEVKALFEQVDTLFGRIDILVNNAGITRDALILRMTESQWDEVIDVNLKAAFLCSKEAAKRMIKQKSGRIINISSVIGQIGNPGQANYSASKSGLFGLTKSLAKELGSRGILVNSIAPGYIVTDMTSGLSDEIRNKLLSSIALGRLGTPEDVAEVALWLANSANYVTGQIISVNGGMF
ncbi:3-oxoacyl-(acyl-carrier-protein) reductase [Thermodesulfobium narugense DSM 14796]|uniref:3-oxoacyl-[acyl-carrier-protein] reductase n=1 Tax=Thermodesulfobium narugense DSM 14796 TaxID=747365 RepID=M1E9C2_9BACT|nr:3-oxoacyl-[acyl-carrier-protein] reductase [Thermodesulfobium narugense]AEE15049.1 3-oxoacyl-(acyl-carrier-protein) reductase [Thermodesulfobium narugense DSM 14796]